MYDGSSNGMNQVVQMMALQALHRTWQESSMGAPRGDAGPNGRRRLQAALFFLICVVPMALLVLRVVAF